MQSSETTHQVHVILAMNDKLNRREFLSRSSVVAASLAGSPWVGRAAETAAPPRSVLDFSAVRKPLATFAVITDTHYAVNPDGNGDHPYAAPLRQTMADVQAAGADFIIHLGDLVNSFPSAPEHAAEVKLARDGLGASRMPIYAVPGNQDVGNKPSLTAARFAANRIRKEWVDAYLQQFKTDYHKIDQAGCRIILLNSALFNSGLAREREQWARLQADLESAKDLKIILGFHTPLFWYHPDDPGANDTEILDQPVRGQVLGLLRKHKVRAVFTGRTHQPIVNTYGNTLLLTAPSTTYGRAFGFYPGHKEITTAPAKRGYLLVRVYDNDLIVNRFRPRTDKLPAGARVIVTRQSAENPGCHLATLIYAPRLFQGAWSANAVVDGKRISQTRQPEEDEQICWSSKDTGKSYCNEWIRLKFSEPTQFDKITLYPRFRPDGMPLNFPTEFAIQTTSSGKQWTALKKFTKFQADPNTPVSVVFKPQKVMGIGVAATRLPGNKASPEGFYFQLTEIELYNGRDKLRPIQVEASSSTEAGARRIDSGVLEACDLGVRYVRMSGAINTSDYAQALLTVLRLGKRPVMSLPPDTRVASEALKKFSKFVALVEAPTPEVYQVAVQAMGDKSRVMAGTVTPDKVADALKLQPVWVSVTIDGTGKLVRQIASQIVELRLANPKTVFWFDVTNAPTSPEAVAQLFLLTYGYGIIVNAWPTSVGDPGALLDLNHDPTPAHRTLRVLTAILSERAKPRNNTQSQLNWLWFDIGANRFVEALWIDSKPVRVALGPERAGATVIDPATGLSRPLPKNSQVTVGKMPVLVCKM